jgi:type IV pilus assembly protein PilB
MEVEKLVPVEKAQKAFRWMIEQPQGIVIFSGPTGSGKTTTIYSAMIQLRKEAVNIVTIEDPVEYVLDGVTQVQVNEAAGVSFANSVRHFLRQDPDILLVGETRDRATAATAIEASLTGHLVLTSLHANDALGAIVRLREMGIEPFLLAHSLIGVVNQRLVRRICAHCREQAVWHPDLIRPMRLFTPEEEGEGGFVFHRGRGCPHCNDQGFKGRIGVFEMLRVSDTLRPSIASGAPSSVMEVEALRHGLLLPLREYCRHLLRAGLTTPEEIARVLFTEA